MNIKTLDFKTICGVEQNKKIYTFIELNVGEVETNKYTIT
jgi:hypothetical protein